MSDLTMFDGPGPAPEPTEEQLRARAEALRADRERVRAAQALLVARYEVEQLEDLLRRARQRLEPLERAADRLTMFD